MPLMRVKVNLKNKNFDLPEMGEDSITGFSAAEEITPATTAATVYVAGKQEVLDGITSQIAKVDCSSQCSTLHMKEAKDKSEKVKEKDAQTAEAKVK